MKIKVGINGMGRIGRMIVRSIIENDIKYLNGTTIFFDGGKSKTLF